MFTSVSGRQLGGRSYLKMTGHHIRIGFITKCPVVPSFEGLSQTAWSSHRYHLQDLKMSGRLLVTGVISRFRVVPSLQGLSQDSGWYHRYRGYLKNTGTSHPRHKILVICCYVYFGVRTPARGAELSQNDGSSHPNRVYLKMPGRTIVTGVISSCMVHPGVEGGRGGGGSGGYEEWW